MRLKCEICDGKLKSTQKLKRAIEADRGYFVICTICRSNAKELVDDDYRCMSIRVNGLKCKAFRFTRNSDLCRFHWGEINV